MSRSIQQINFLFDLGTFLDVLFHFVEEKFSSKYPKNELRGNRAFSGIVLEETSFQYDVRIQGSKTNDLNKNSSV